MTVEVHHLSRLALKCNLLGDRRQARRKHRQLHLGHPTSLGQLSPPRNRSAHYRSKGTQKTPGTSGGQSLVSTRHARGRTPRTPIFFLLKHVLIPLPNTFIPVIGGIR